MGHHLSEPKSLLTIHNNNCLTPTKQDRQKPVEMCSDIACCAIYGSKSRAKTQVSIYM